jgi:GNAT superfamily N-acetyltransferase
MEIALLEPERGEDAELVRRLTALINDVYAASETGLWLRDAARTSATDVAEFIRAGEVAVASRDGRIAGSVRIHDVGPGVSEFGLLVAAPADQGTGVGRALLDFVERDGRERGLRAVQLELLSPRERPHPSKEFLKEWYGRRGYRVIRTESPGVRYPGLAAMLATPCELEIREKELRD